MKGEKCKTCGNEMERHNGKKWYCRRCGTIYDYFKNGKYHVVVPEFIRWKNAKEEPPSKDDFYLIAYIDEHYGDKFFIELCCYDFDKNCFKNDKAEWYRETDPLPKE
jgi:hypothetical protein